MVEYHKLFQNLHSKAIEAVRVVIRDGLWRVDNQHAFVMLRGLADELTSIYNIPPVSVTSFFTPIYWGGSDIMGLPHPSIVSFLHEFRHHMIHYGLGHYSDIERDSRGWSISLFRRAAPKSFRKAWKAGTIMFMPPYPEEAGTNAAAQEV